MGISTTADGRQWAGFDVYDLAYERGQGKTDKQIYDQLMAEGFSASQPAGSSTRIGPDAWSALQASINQPAPTTPTTPTEDPLDPHKTTYTNAIYEDPNAPAPAPWNFEYGANNTPAITYSNVIAPESGGTGLNSFSQEFLADNSVYQALAPSIAPKTTTTAKKSDPSVFEKIMNQSVVNPAASPQTFQQVIQNY